MTAGDRITYRPAPPDQGHAYTGVVLEAQSTADGDGPGVELVRCDQGGGLHHMPYHCVDGIAGPCPCRRCASNSST
jgi:hypothetical protein